MNPLSIKKLGRNPYPKQIIVDIHSYCNAKCKVCPYDSLKTKIPMGVMDENLFTKIIDEFAELSKANLFRGQVLFCNMGELFVRPAMAIDRMNYVIQSGLDFNIQTNAALLHPSVIDRLKNSGFQGVIVISLHGISPNVYKDSMGLDVTGTLRNIGSCFSKLLQLTE